MKHEGLYNLNEMSTPALKSLLEHDLQCSETEMLPPEMVNEIVLILEKREKESGTFYEINISEAWGRFEKDYLSRETSIDNYKFGGKESSGYTGKRRNFSFMRKTQSAAAAVLLLVSLAITAQASGLDIFSFVGKWTEETFSFEKVIETQEMRDYRDAAREWGIDENLLITWYPSHYQMEKLEIYPIDDEVTFFLPFTDENDSEKCFSVYLLKIAGVTDVTNFLVEKSDTPVIQYESKDRMFYIMDNITNKTAVWTDGEYLISISGNLTEDEMYKIIDSIGE